MIVTTTDVIPGASYQVLGLCRGNIAYSRHIGRDLMAGLKNIAGGEIKSYTELVSEARSIAEQRMEEEARAMGADAVIAMRFLGDTVAEGTIEVVAYGTAVKFV